MREMGWTYEEVQACPYEVYADIVEFMTVENQYQQKRLKDASK